MKIRNDINNIIFKSEEDLIWMNKTAMFYINSRGGYSPTGCRVIEKDEMLRLLPWVDYKIINDKPCVSNHFTISRVNKVFYDTWRDVQDLIGVEELFSMFMMKIIDKWKDKEYVEINTSENESIEDDLKILGGIRKELKHEVLLDNGIDYNRNKEKDRYEVLIDKKVDLDELDSMGMISGGEDFDIEKEMKNKKNKGIEKFYEIINNSGLTKREKEYIIALEQNDYNQYEAAHTIGLARKSGHVYLRRIKKKIKTHYNRNGERIK